MTTEVIMPQMGESVTEGTITTWFKQVGDFIEKDEPLLLISTDKVDADVPSPASGYLIEHRFPEGTTVDIDTVIAILSDSQTGSSPSPSAAAAPDRAEPSDPSPTPKASATPSASDSKATDVDELRRQRSSPLVRKMAAEHQVDLGGLSGTGVSGRVTKSDLLAHLETREKAPRAPVAAPSAPSRPAPDARYLYSPVPTDRVEPFSPMRNQIADHMVVSRETSVHVTTVFEVDMTRVVKLRQKHKGAYASKGAKLSYMPFILRAVVDGLNAYPVMNSSVVDRSVAYRSEINLGMAVAVDWGLLVPVIRRADELSVLGLSRQVQDLADRSRERKLSPDDLQGGTFTVTNPGVFGSLFGTPIINQPQVGILCVGTITKRPMVTEDDAIAIRHMMYLALSFDHRIVDGATGDRFMKVVKDTLEQFPEELL